MSNLEVKELARKIAKLEKGVRSLSTAPRLSRTSIDNGSIPEYDADGNLVSIIGTQPDGTHGVVNYVGPTPPVPSAPTGEGSAAQITVTWGGTFTDSAPAPLDLLGVEVYVAAADFQNIEDAAFVGRMPGAEAGSLAIGLVAGTYHVGLVAVSNSYRRSGVSERIVLTSTSVLDPSFVTDLEARLEQAETEVAAAQIELDGLFQVGGDGTVAISSAAGAAQQAAIDAAALDATAKADAAAAAAELAAKAHADLVASGAESDAIDAAALDATAKADAAQAAAIAAAAAAADAKIAAVPKIFHSAGPATTTEGDPGSTAAPNGSTWFKHYLALTGGVIKQWTRVNGAWAETPIRSEVIANLDAGKITSGVIDTNRLNASEIAATIATIIQLNADRITSGTVDTARLNATEIAAAVATIIQLNADRITSGTVGTDRLDATEIAAAVATIIELNADRIVTGQLASARIDTTNLVAGGGVYVTTTTPEGVVEERINLTGTGEQSVSIYDSGEFMAGMGADGTVTGNLLTAPAVSAGESFLYRNQELDQILGGKIIARGYRDTGGASVTIPVNGTRDFLQVSFDAEPGHSYRVTASGPAVQLLYPGTYSANNLRDAYGSARIKIGIDTIPGPASGYEVRSLRFIGPGYSTATSSLVINREPTDAPAVITAVYSMGGSTGYGITTLAAYDDIDMIVEDLGSTVADTGIALNGTTAPTDVVKSYTYTDTLEWHQNYTGAGGQYNYNNARHYQGYYLSSNGVLKSMLGFPDIMRTRLAGSSVDKIEVWLSALHWNNSTGGRARVGTHNMDTKPATFSGNNSAEWSFGRGVAAWVTLPSSWYPYYADGTFKGITLGFGATTDPIYYGYFDAAATQVRYTYRK